MRRVQRWQEHEPRSMKSRNRGQVHLSIAGDATVAPADAPHVGCSGKENGLSKQPNLGLGGPRSSSEFLVAAVLGDAAPDDHDVAFRWRLFAQVERPHERPFA